MKVAKRKTKLDAAGATALFVVHDEPQLVRDVMLDGLDDVPFPVLVDRDRAAYDRWGCTRISWWKLWLDPNVWRSYAEQLRAGERIRGSGADTRQLGGDWVVAPDSTLAYARRQQRDDRPPAGELVDLAVRLGRGSEASGPGRG